MKKHLRILVAKVGLDGHDRGAKLLARGLADEGMEVIYTGLRRTPQQVVNMAIQEDVDAIMVSVHSGAHDVLVPRVMALLRESQADDKMVFVGGLIPEEDTPALKACGVTEVCGTGVSTINVAGLIRQHLKR